MCRITCETCGTHVMECNSKAQKHTTPLILKLVLHFDFVLLCMNFSHIKHTFHMGNVVLEHFRGTVCEVYVKSCAIISTELHMLDHVVTALWSSSEIEIQVFSVRGAPSVRNRWPCKQKELSDCVVSSDFTVLFSGQCYNMPLIQNCSFCCQANKQTFQTSVVLNKCYIPIMPHICWSLLFRVVNLNLNVIHSAILTWIVGYFSVSWLIIQNPN